MLEEFEAKSEALISERQILITEIERAIYTKRYELSETHYKLFSTNSISILYSMWEGFVQNLFGLYIDEINKEEIPLFNLSNNLIIFCKERNFRQLKEYPNKVGQKISYMKKLKLFYTQDVHEIPRTVDTESNIGFEVLNKLLENFNLGTYPESWEKYKYPEPNLKENFKTFLRLRNTVAHGGELLPNESIDQKVFNRFKNLTLDMMYDIREKMIFAIKKTKYKTEQNRVDDLATE